MPSLDKSALRPLAYPHLTRLGPLRDGGYVVPQDQLAHCRFLLSLGLSDNWQFDKDFLRLNPNLIILGVDHTVGAAFFLKGLFRSLWKTVGYAILCHTAKRNRHFTRLRVYREYFTFFRPPHKHLKRRVTGNVVEPIDISLGDILHAYASGTQPDVFLKIDIEGSEYDTMADILKNQSRIRCLVIEFHALSRRTAEFNEAFRRLQQHFLTIHLHGNNYGRYDPANNFPDMIEMTLINKNLVPHELPPSTTPYPRPGLDFPNNPTLPDCQLAFA